MTFWNFVCYLSNYLEIALSYDKIKSGGMFLIKDKAIALFNFTINCTVYLAVVVGSRLFSQIIDYILGFNPVFYIYIGLFVFNYFSEYGLLKEEKINLNFHVKLIIRSMTKFLFLVIVDDAIVKSWLYVFG